MAALVIGREHATVGVLQNEVSKSQEYLERVQKRDERLAAGSLDLPSTPSSGRAGR